MRLECCRFDPNPKPPNTVYPERDSSSAGPAKDRRSPGMVATGKTLRSAALICAFASGSAFLTAPPTSRGVAAVPHACPSPFPAGQGLASRPRCGARTALAATQAQRDRFHAGRIVDRGFTVLPDPVISRDLVDHVREESSATLSRLLTEVHPSHAAAPHRSLDPPVCMCQTG